MKSLILALLILAALPAGAQPRDVGVDSSPPGAQVFDQTYTPGRPEGYLGKTPCTLRLDDGSTHALYFVSPGWGTVKERVGLGDVRVRATLPPTSLRAWLARHPLPTALIVIGLLAAAWRLRRRFARLEHALAVRQLDGDNLLGHSVDGYLVLACLGEGAFAEVFRVEHLEYGDVFAMKVLRREVARGEVRDRFAREMAVGRDLHHPVLVPVHAFGELEDGRPYMVMELLPGCTLARRLEHGPMAVGEALPLIEQAVDGLRFAHSHGVIHRDLKPDNIMLSGDRIRIMDFGIARLIGGRRLTVSNAALGTPLYMSPEHLNARAIDERSDIYSLGVIAYEMLAGHPPFEGEEAFAVLAGHLRGRAPDLPENVPGNLAAIVMRMMERDPRARYQTMRDVAAALQGVRIAA
jgi:tRNA A-37 threonylcarbamoyl transferase component Bud32